MFADFPIFECSRDTHSHWSWWEFPSQPISKVWIQGSPQSLSLLDKLPEKGLAMVGSRRPSPRSLQFVRDLRWHGSHLILISGLAEGIDASVHESALESRTPTLAVLGSGFKRIYPNKNRDLALRILKSGGLLVSEYEPLQEAKPWHFILRNRIIAALSRALVVVQAVKKSGSMGTVNWAQELHRTVYAVPSFPGDSSLAGNQYLLDQGQAHCFWGIHSLGSEWLELAGQPDPILGPSGSKAAALLSWIEGYHYTSQKLWEGASVQKLYDQAYAAGWSSSEFFNTLRYLQKGAWIHQEGQVFLPVKSDTFRQKPS